MMQRLLSVEFLLASLLPGFLVAYVLYALVSHKRPSLGERVFLATLFSFLVKLLVSLERRFFEALGTKHNFGSWSVESEFFWAISTSIVCGLLLAKLVNSEAVFKLSRVLGVSAKNGHPSEWYWAFHNYKDCVVLHFKDGRRLRGFPEVWPTDPEKGHFFIYRPTWVDIPEAAEQTDTEGILVNVKLIQHVEILRSNKESINEPKT
jgi:hypothetical protein